MWYDSNHGIHRYIKRYISYFMSQTITVAKVDRLISINLFYTHKVKTNIIIVKLHNSYNV